MQSPHLSTHCVLSTHAYNLPKKYAKKFAFTIIVRKPKILHKRSDGQVNYWLFIQRWLNKTALFLVQLFLGHSALCHYCFSDGRKSCLIEQKYRRSFTLCIILVSTHLGFRKSALKDAFQCKVLIIPFVRRFVTKSALFKYEIEDSVEK